MWAELSRTTYTHSTRVLLLCALHCTALLHAYMRMKWFSDRGEVGLPTFFVKFCQKIPNRAWFLFSSISKQVQNNIGIQSHAHVFLVEQPPDTEPFEWRTHVPAISFLDKIGQFQVHWNLAELMITRACMTLHYVAVPNFFRSLSRDTRN